MGKEAVVVVLDGTSIVTDECSICELDALRCTVSDLEFSRPFSLAARWNTKVEGLAALFDTFFEVDGQQKAFFSTSPSSTSTHWKQTFFYFPSGPVTVRRIAMPLAVLPALALLLVPVVAIMMHILRVASPLIFFCSCSVANPSKAA